MDPFSSLLPELECVDRTVAAHFAEFDLDPTDVRALIYAGGKRLRARLLIHSVQVFLAEVPQAEVRLASDSGGLESARRIALDVLGRALSCLDTFGNSRSANGVRALAAHYPDRPIIRPTEASARAAAEDRTAARGGQPAGVVKRAG